LICFFIRRSSDCILRLSKYDIQPPNAAMDTLLKRSLSLYYFAFSLAGMVALLILNNGETLFLAAGVPFAVLAFLIAWEYPQWSLLICLVIAALAPLLTERWEELVLVMTAAVMAGFFFKRLFTKDGYIALRAADRLLFLFSLIVLVSTAATAWRYIEFQSVAGVLPPGMQINVWGFTVDYVERSILVESTFLFLIAPLVIIAAELRRQSVTTKILKGISIVALAIIIVLGVLAALPLVPGISGYSIFAGAGEWPLAIGTAIANVAGTGLGTYQAEAGNHSVLIGRPQQPTSSGPALAGKMAAELGIFFTALLLAVMISLVWDSFRRGALKVVIAGALLFAAVMIFFTSVPFVREAVFLYVLLCGLVVPKEMSKHESSEASYKRWLGYSLVLLVIFIPGIFISSVTLNLEKSWERLRWPMEAGIYPEEGEGGFRWTGKSAVKTMTPDKRFLHIEWFTGNQKAQGYRPNVNFYWDERLVESVTEAGSENRHLFIPMVAAGDQPHIFAVVTAPPFVPDEFLGNGDRRELGIALVRLEFVDELLGGSEGFWEPEGDSNQEFRWSQGDSYLSVPLSKPFKLKLRAGHPDVGEEPVTVELSLNGILERTLMLTGREWMEITIDPRKLPAEALPGWHASLLPEATGILRIKLNRTWIPADYAVSEDRRALGVAVSGIEVLEEQEQ
jgi:hypothetical protein